MTTHGTRAEYQAGCRCDPCTTANTRYMQLNRAGIAQLLPQGVSPREFGAWRNQAACAGTGVDFYPQPPSADGKHGHKSADPAYRAKVAAAKAVCAGCTVRQECLDTAMESSWFHDFGIRGGMTASERDQVRRSRRRAG